jgi:hypothetical protein
MKTSFAITKQERGDPASFSNLRSDVENDEDERGNDRPAPQHRYHRSHLNFLVLLRSIGDLACEKRFPLVVRERRRLRALLTSRGRGGKIETDGHGESREECPSEVGVVEGVEGDVVLE